ncbi:MAG: metal-sulfur cluster assembly factor [Bacteroidetes bacterium]|nr:metal-sulfur cluster assembly factor [Bacteroidota bacterium]
MAIITNNNIKSTIALASLESVYDPEIGLNVVDLGLIYQIDFDETAKEVFCRMTLTTQFCPMGESITDGVKNTLAGTFPGYTARLELTFDPPWNFQMISEEGREFLNR